VKEFRDEKANMPSPNLQGTRGNKDYDDLDIDQLFIKRGAVMMTDSGVQRRIQDMMLDRTGKRDREYLLMGSTNHIEQMDNAIMRPGRFDEAILQMTPSTPARKEILIIHTTKLRHMPMVKDFDYDVVAKETSGFTPAELEKVVVSAGRLAMKERAEFVTNAHFESTLANMTINMQERSNRIQAIQEAMKAIDIVNKQFLDQTVADWSNKETDKSRVQSFINKM
jgi:ATP-dependent Zn protease